MAPAEDSPAPETSSITKKTWEDKEDVLSQQLPEGHEGREGGKSCDRSSYQVSPGEWRRENGLLEIYHLHSHLAWSTARMLTSRSPSLVRIATVSHE